jgi:hypothetical protein
LTQHIRERFYPDLNEAHPPSYERFLILVAHHQNQFTYRVNQTGEEP